MTLPPSIALLCPGPSLSRLWSDELFAEYDEVIAVNTAGHYFRCHWLAAVDRHVIDPFLKKEIRGPETGFITHRSWQKLLTPLGYQIAFANPYFGQDIPDFLKRRMKCDRCGYTMPNALNWIRHRAKYQKIHVYGFDCAVGEADIGNVTGDRSGPRFWRELNWIKAYWHPEIAVNSDIDPKILHWLNHGDQKSEPPIPYKPKTTKP